MSEQAGHARTVLLRDRAWCAYALADSEEPYVSRTEFRVAADAVVTIYRGLTPPWLFAHGAPEEVDRLLDQVPAGTYQYGLLATHRARLGPRLSAARETHMWRMLLRPADFPTQLPGAAMALTRADEAEIDALFAGHPDRPDTYDPRQVREGVFYGVRRGGRLVSVAGTHVIGPATGVAALGNVFTHPDHRRRGYGRTASAAVTSALLERRIQTIVLNVTMDNEPALDLYRGLGFMPFCGYYEGVGALAAA